MVYIVEVLIWITTCIITYVAGRRDGIAYATKKINEVLDKRGLPRVRKIND